MNPQEIIFSKGKLFWFGIAMCFVSPPFPAILYGIMLCTDPKTRRDGVIVIAWSIVWTIITTAFAVYMAKNGHPLLSVGRK